MSCSSAGSGGTLDPTVRGGIPSSRACPRRRVREGDLDQLLEQGAGERRSSLQARGPDASDRGRTRRWSGSAVGTTTARLAPIADQLVLLLELQLLLFRIAAAQPLLELPPLAAYPARKAKIAGCNLQPMHGDQSIRFIAVLKPSTRGRKLAAAIPCRAAWQGNAFPAGRAGWALPDTPIPLNQHEFSANEPG